jgi:hypothetical protein
MAFWVWVVAILVLSLVAYETISWIRRRTRPDEEVESEEAQRAAEALAELARANMKIAVLETRLEEAEIKHEDEQAALEAKHKEQMAKTEAAYQRQMVVLSERLASNGKGDWRVAAQREKAKQRADSERYPVRMAAEVAAWKAETFGEVPGVDTAVSKGESTSTKQNDTSIERTDPAVNTPPAETADPNSAAQRYEVISHPRPNGVAAAVAAISGLSLAEIEATVEDEYGRLDDAPDEVQAFVAALAEHEGLAEEEPPEITAAPAALDNWQMAEEMTDVEDIWLPDHDEEVLEQITVYEAHSYDDAPEQTADMAGLIEPEASGENEAGSGDLPYAGELLDDLNAAEEAAADSGEAADSLLDSEAEVNFFGSPLPEDDDPARQRALARRLASEMDADYLDDDEFFKEMGIRQFAPEPLSYAGEEMEDIMGGENWVTDPIEELAYHLNGEYTNEPDEASAAEAPDYREGEEFDATLSEASVEENGRALDLSDEAWEEMVYKQEIASAPADDSQTDSMDMDDEESNDEEPFIEDRYEDEERPFIPPEQGAGADDAAIAATVAAILARAPNRKKQVNDAPERTFGPQGAEEPFEIPYEEQPLEEAALAGVPQMEGAVAAAGANGARKATLPPFVWQREPILWEAEYYANTRLAEAPLVVRKDKEIDFDWRGMAPAQGIEPRCFSVRWTGLLPLEAGQYRFTASAPDGMRLWLNDRLVISAWYDQSEQTYHRDVFWHGGPIDVRVEHYENGGDAKAFLTWERVA